MFHGETTIPGYAQVNIQKHITSKPNNGLDVSFSYRTFPHAWLINAKREENIDKYQNKNY